MSSLQRRRHARQTSEQEENARRCESAEFNSVPWVVIPVHQKRSDLLSLCRRILH